MKLTLSWLKDHLETNASLDELCEKLTAIGLEVEEVQDRGASLAPFIVAQIVETGPHPDADRLKLCKVTTGKETLQIVCGAPNARTGLKVVLARAGDVIPSTGQPLKEGNIRGQMSQGMMCSTAELGIDEDHAGIMELPSDTSVGARFIDVVDVADPVITINLTPNRADCAGVRGIARDLAAAGMGTLKPLRIAPPKGQEPCGVKVRLNFPEDQKQNCPLFVGYTLRHIRNCESPAWMQARLRAIGLRPISALVDITNYLTFDCNRPLHVFDCALLKGDLWVAPAKGGEVFKALNDKSYTLEAGMTAIGDESGFLSLAGVIGGESSGCGPQTAAVFLESAYFDPVRTAQTGRALDVTSDARYRFERGVDPDFVISGADLAAQMIVEICGTEQTIVSERQIVGAPPDLRRAVDYHPSKVKAFVGVDVALAEQEQILTTLGFDIEKRGADEWRVTAPSWRGDIDGAADLVEEIMRIKGYDSIPAVSMPRLEAVNRSGLNDLDRRAEKSKRALAARGMMEVVTWSFMSSKVAQAFGPVRDDLRLLNPISSDLDVMRSSILGNLIQAAQRNASRGYADVALFEVGPTYRDQTPEGQILTASALRAGGTPRHWAEKRRNADVYDAKADALAVLASVGITAHAVQIIAGQAPSWYHPARSGALKQGPVLLGYFGAIHPAILEACDAKGAHAGCEIFLSSLPVARKGKTARSLLKLESLQPLSRDFAFVLDRKIEAAEVLDAIKKAEKKYIRAIEIFDVYEGQGIEDGKKSLALTVQFQPLDHSLTEGELEALSRQIVSAVEKAAGAVLRGA
ncbi:MAG: phenylalanine--tRNA ligase subunit beta [Alphaproteobacteria bacterium]|nr:phenylalanine--tRNA ligase subunit beta [Alphaproteobacteria bacterium]